MLHLDPHLPEILSDPAYLRQVILNIAKNGIEAMDPGGTLTVSTGAQDSRVFVQIGETGMEIPPEIQHDVRAGDAARGTPGVLFLAHMMQAVPCILLIGEASFLYIALADLTPYLHRRFGLADNLLQLGLILAGIFTICLFHILRN